MGSRISRRELLKRIGAAGAAAGSFARPASSAQTTGQPSIVIAGQPIEVVITPASALTTRISLLPDGAQPVPSDGSLVERPWPAPAARLTRLGGPRTVASGQLSVEVAWSRRDGTTTAEALSLRVQAGNGLIQDLRVDQETAAVTFSTGDGPLLGLGEGGPQFDRRGSMVGARSGQGGYQLRTHGGRVPVQWLIDTSRGALFIHWPYGAFDLMGSEGRFVPSAGPTSGSDATPPIALPLDVFVVGTREPVAIMSEYAMLTGRPEMPPLWSLGYQQSHRTLASRDEILQEAKMFREKRLPCETLIYLGTGFCPSGWNTDNGEFTFNPKVFPDPKAVVDALHDIHFKVALHIVLEGRTLTGTVKDPCTAPPLPSGKTPDGQWPDDRQVSCYWPVHKLLFDLGVDGWWPDQGDGLDASSRLARNRMYWDGAREWRPGERPFALHRNGHAGMQRYASFLWSGDVYSTWETLKTHIPVAINTGLSGVPYWGTDIGGFVPTKELTGELYVRWFQFGAFCPLFRAHGRTWKLRLPWGWNTGSLDPDEVANYTGGAANPDPSELHNPAVEPICRKYLELRSRLLPYLYSAVYAAHTTGLPIVRALWLHYPDDRRAVARGDEYLWGRDLLVAPVVEKGATSRSVYLPRGRWYDFWTEDVLNGSGEILRTVDLATMPLFVRAGAILPLGPVKQYISEPVDEPVTLHIYPGADGAFVWYEDDGRSFAHQRGDWMGVDMRWNDRRRTLTLRLADGSRMRPPAPRRIRARLVGAPSIRDIVFSGAVTEVQL